MRKRKRLFSSAMDALIAELKANVGVLITRIRHQADRDAAAIFDEIKKASPRLWEVKDETYYPKGFFSVAGPTGRSLAFTLDATATFEAAQKEHEAKFGMSMIGDTFLHNYRRELVRELKALATPTSKDKGAVSFKISEDGDDKTKKHMVKTKIKYEVD
jgi:hypothetical protein